MEEKINYNDVPVEYCRNAACCSLAVVEDDDGIYCKDCGCTKFLKAHVDEWREYYFEAHGRYLLDIREEYLRGLCYGDSE